jgi:hypothetical protein
MPRAEPCLIWQRPVALAPEWRLLYGYFNFFQILSLGRNQVTSFLACMANTFAYENIVSTLVFLTIRGY